MKSYLTALFILCAGILSAQSTTFHWGLKAGANLAQHYAPKPQDNEYKVKARMRAGAIAGAYLDMQILPNLTLGYELLYSMKGSREDIQILAMEGETLAKPARMNVEYDLDYLEFPVLLKINTVSYGKLQMQAITGTAMSLKLHGAHRLDGTIYIPNGDDYDVILISEQSDLPGINIFDYSFVYGSALIYKGAMEASLELRFTLGWDYLQLPTFSLSEQVELRNQTYSAILSIKF